MTDHTATSAAYMVGGTRAIFAGAVAFDPPGAVAFDPPGAVAFDLAGAVAFDPPGAPARVPLCWSDLGATSPILHRLCDS